MTRIELLEAASMKLAEAVILLAEARSDGWPRLLERWRRLSSRDTKADADTAKVLTMDEARRDRGRPTSQLKTKAFLSNE